MADIATKMETVNLRLPASEVRMAEKRAAELGSHEERYFQDGLAWRDADTDANPRVALM